MDRASEQRGRRRRLVIIVVVAAVLVIGGSVPLTIGQRRVDREVTRIRAAATTAKVDPAQFLFAMTHDVVDPVDVALGTDADVSAVQGNDRSWCVTLEVTRLLSKRSVFFTVADDGALTEAAGCTG